MSKIPENNKNRSLVKYEDFLGCCCPFSIKKKQSFVNNGTDNLIKTKTEADKYNEDNL
ncbi:MAG: hypothetical protein PHW62_05090 [Candidatus Ratteibacteria bacterium]|nr:hypothetical protein [Candidatus Ratteibacteria bacterium]